MPPFRYALPQVLVHWAAALAVLFLLATGTLVLADLPNTAQKVSSLRIHMIVGGLAGLLVIARIAMGRRMAAPPALPGDRLARAGHVALNLVVLLMLLSGAMLAWQSGALDAVAGGGALPEDFSRFMPRRVHGLASRLAMALVALHVAAALYHQFILGDRLLSRMRLGGR